MVRVTATMIPEPALLDDFTPSERIGPTGRPFTESSIGSDLAMRNLMTSLRETGEIRGGGRPFTKQDRSRFLGALDTAIQAILSGQKTVEQAMTDAAAEMDEIMNGN